MKEPAKPKKATATKAAPKPKQAPAKADKQAITDTPVKDGKRCKKPHVSQPESTPEAENPPSPAPVVAKRFRAKAADPDPLAQVQALKEAGDMKPCSNKYVIFDSKTICMINTSCCPQYCRKMLR